MKDLKKVKKELNNLKKTRPPKDGMISIADIASELKMHPRIARAILREAKIKKPDGGWSWPKGDKTIATITALIKKGK